MEDKLFKYTHKGNLHIADVAIPCFVLEDGRRVISGRGLTKAIGMKGRGPGASRIPTHSTLKPYITPELEEAINNPIEIMSGGLPVDGYEATVLLSVCESILNARDAGVLKTRQEIHYARACEALVRAFAKVGIIALVDEATGYQADRDKEELQKILKAYIQPELLPWTKRFDKEFYEQLFRLRGWQYSPLSIKRPKLVSLLTVQLVYDKLPPGVLDELRRLNPVDAETGRRKHKHHQHLTESTGVRHLEKHLAVVIALMRISPNWRVFEAHFNRAFPSRYVQDEMDFGEEEADSTI